LKGSGCNYLGRSLNVRHTYNLRGRGITYSCDTPGSYEEEKKNAVIKKGKRRFRKEREIMSIIRVMKEEKKQFNNYCNG